MGKGQLLFKGEKAKKKTKKSKHSSSNENDVTTRSSATVVVDRSGETRPSSVEQASLSRPHNATPIAAAPAIKTGTGKITTSGTVVTGYDTRFEKELNPGDAIMCKVENGTEELRVVTMRLSNVSMNLSTAFSTNLKVPSAFQCIRKPRDLQKEKAEAQKRSMETLNDQKTHAFDLYGNESLVYREKTENGSYRIKQEPLNAANSGPATLRSRGDLLEMRAKKTSDKFC
jgi:hypothetical protein